MQRHGYVNLALMQMLMNAVGNPMTVARMLSVSIPMEATTANAQPGTQAMEKFVKVGFFIHGGK